MAPGALYDLDWQFFVFLEVYPLFPSLAACADWCLPSRIICYAMDRYALLWI